MRQFILYSETEIYKIGGRDLCGSLFVHAEHQNATLDDTPFSHPTFLSFSVLMCGISMLN